MIATGEEEEVADYNALTQAMVQLLSQPRTPAEADPDPLISSGRPVPDR